MSKKKYFGIVEGFFSRPLMKWTHEQRLKLLKQMSEYTPNFNCYFYCPKDDSFVTKKPFALYDESTIQEFSQYSRICKNQGLSFVYGINPPFALDDIEKGGIDTYCDKIMIKLGQLSAVGIKDFCLLYDDIPFAYNYLSGSQDPQEEEIARIMAEVVNTLTKKLSSQEGLLRFCSPEYFFQQQSVFNSILCESIDPKVGFIYTGNKVFTGHLDKNMTSQMRNIVGKERSVIFRDNYPVNDEPIGVGQYFFGAWNKPSDEAIKDIDSVLINPMREANISLPNLMTFNYYLNNPEQDYDRNKLYYQAREKLGDNGSIGLFTHTRSQTNCVDQESQGLWDIEYKNSIRGHQWIAELVKNYEDAKQQLTFLNSSVQKELSVGLEKTFLNAKNVIQVLQEIENNDVSREIFDRVNTIPLMIKKTGVKGTLKLILNYLNLYYTNCDEYITIINTGKPINDMPENLHFLQPLVQCYNFILGKNTIHLTQEWEESYQNIMKNILKKEADIFFEYLLNQKILIEEKIATFSRRLKTFIF